MAAARWWRYARLAFLSQPTSARQLYRLIKRHQVGRIVEIGISDVARSVAMIEVAQRYVGGKTVRHTGLDWFEGSQQQIARLPLKDAYRLLRATGASLQLVPGNPARSLAAVANAHQGSDLIVISSKVTDEELQPAWFYLPRMLHERSVILREHPASTTGPSFEQLSHSRISEWARSNYRRAA